MKDEMKLRDDMRAHSIWLKQASAALAANAQPGWANTCAAAADSIDTFLAGRYPTPVIAIASPQAREIERDQIELGMQFALWMRGREFWPTIQEVVAHWKMAPAFAYLMLAGYCEAADIEAMP